MASELDRLLPTWDFAERHARSVHAPPPAVYRAIKDLTLREIPVAAALFAVRSLPERLLRRPQLPSARNRPLLDQFFEGSFTLLADVPDVEVVAGLVARTGRLGELVPLAGTHDFHTVGAAGLVKVAMNFTIDPGAAGCRLRTETRVLASDRPSRRAFRRYWLVIRPFSGLIRREWLRAIARRAERAADVKTAAA